MGILWYDEENDQYVIIDSTLNEETSTISATVPHFSTYLVVNLTRWQEIMSDYYFTLNQPKRYEIFYDEVSWGRARFECFMKGGHLATITSYGEEQEVEKLTKNKYTSFWIGATYLYPSYLTRDNTYWAWENNEVFSYTNWGETGFYTSLMMDDYTGYYASEAHGYIYEDKWYKMIDLGAPTGGTIYRTFGYICEWDNVIDNFRDDDNDGLPDSLEESGMLVQSGEYIKTSKYCDDCDGDGLKDGEEIILKQRENGIYYFVMKSDPNMADKDNDGIPDHIDALPTTANQLGSSNGWSTVNYDLLTSKLDIKLNSNNIKDYEIAESKTRFWSNHLTEMYSSFSNCQNSDGLIFDQHLYPVSNMQYGSNETMNNNGCELIGIYNALRLTGRYQMLSEIAFECEINKATQFNLSFFSTHPTFIKYMSKYISFVNPILSNANYNFSDGSFGTNPFYIELYLNAHNIHHEVTMDLDEFNRWIKPGRVFILTCWNENSITSMIHTFAIWCDDKGLIHSINGYGDEENFDSYNSVSYENLSQMLNGRSLISAYYLY